MNLYLNHSTDEQAKNKSGFGMQHHVAMLEQQQAAAAMVKPMEQQRMLEQFQFSGEDQPISSLLQLAPLPPQLQPYRVQPTQPNLQEFSLSIPDPSNYIW